MPGEQFLAFHKETNRGTTPATPTRLFLPLVDGIEPKYAPKDEAVKEFKGANVALGDSTVRRKEHQYTISPKARLYPGKEMGIFLTHLLGFAGTRSLVDTTARKGIVYPVAMPFGSGAPLADTALGIVPNLDRDGTTRSQVYAGARLKTATIAIKPPEDITIAFEGMGAGNWVGPANQAVITGVSFPAALPFNYYDAKFYIGSGATRTGTAPDYTDIAPGTMAAFQPDDCNIKITNGLDDKTVLNGIKGPSKTERTGQFAVEMDFTVDFRDPATGFSAIDTFESIFTGPRTDSLMVVLNNGQLAGSATENYKMVIDIPLALISAENPNRTTDGVQSKVKFQVKSLFSDVAKYPIAFLTVDQADAY